MAHSNFILQRFYKVQAIMPKIYNQNTTSVKKQATAGTSDWMNWNLGRMDMVHRNNN